MKMLRFKFQHDCTINEEFDIYEGGEGGASRGQGEPIYKFQSQLSLLNMKMLSFKFQHDRTINEEFDIFEGGRGRGLQGA